ncbi:hypothetical protein [Actinoplanes lobatus]|uniref:Uncharacterized protein n=1 Tax=Actinoplanes lobatus TaxID=113568 RepID=A0A7W7MMG6_9ACTN|nr:hypothetical protein [Actinoplanes lobatus]MBB4755341.1 hypothetical protein [Actinoplanes lobatus]GIE46399.1 hypothetical protein Alo02nite_92970 [Actinoplanes lobatus]
MYPQRCTKPDPHGPHRVHAVGFRTGFTCAGSPPVEDDLPPADHEHLIPGRIWPLT